MRIEPSPQLTFPGNAAGKRSAVNKVQGAGLLAMTLLALSAMRSPAATGLSLAWDRNTEPVAGYKLYYGTVSGTYSSSVDAGNSTSVNVPELIAGVTYFFVVTAYDANRSESAPSSEISAVAPNPATLTVTSIPQNRPLPEEITADLTIQSPEGADFTLNLAGPAQTAVFIYASSSCTDWELLGTVANPTGQLQIRDLESSRFERRYYRFQRVEMSP